MVEFGGFEGDTCKIEVVLFVYEVEYSRVDLDYVAILIEIFY